MADLTKLEPRLNALYLYQLQRPVTLEVASALTIASRIGSALQINPKDDDVGYVEFIELNSVQ